MKAIATTLAVVGLLGVLQTTNGQTCDRIYLRTQADIDAFSCVNVFDLTIGPEQGATDSDITNLGGLSGLRRVYHDLTIKGTTRLTSLRGLEGLRDVGSSGGTLNIGGYLTISENAALQSLNGFDNLTEIGGRLYINNNPALVSTDGFPSLQSIGFGLGFTNNPSVIRIEGFNALTTASEGFQIYSYFIIRNNAGLVAIDGFNNMGSAGYTFIIADNPRLVDLSGLRTYQGSPIVEIENNDALLTLSGLSSFRYVGYTLVLKNNSALRDCACTLADLIVGGEFAYSKPVVNITGNAEGCASPQQIFERVAVCQTEPLAERQQLETNENVALPVRLWGRGGAVLQFAIVQAPVNGKLSGDPPHLTYTPTIGFAGVDRIMFTVNNGIATSAPAEVTITVKDLPLNEQANQLMEAIYTAAGRYRLNWNLVNGLTRTINEVQRQLATGNTAQLHQFIGAFIAQTRMLLEGKVPPREAGYLIGLGQALIEDLRVELSEKGLPPLAIFPSPFNPETQIRFVLAETSPVRLTIFDALGREVARLVDETLPAGEHGIRWNAGDRPSGVYFCRLEYGIHVETQRMVLLK